MPLTSSPPQDNLLLDMYLAPHVRTLYTQIRNRALIQVSVGVGKGMDVRAVWTAGLLRSSAQLWLLSCSTSAPMCQLTCTRWLQPSTQQLQLWKMS